MALNIIPYNPKLKPLAAGLRKNSTLAEVLLWNRLKNKQFGEYDFHRQKPLGNFIYDFYCPKLKLVIEIDGESHNHEETFANDLKKEEFLKQYDIKIIRFTEKEVRRNIAQVLEIIESFIEE